jgi:hypothetical protein
VEDIAMKIDIESLSEAELAELNSRIVARLRLLQQLRTEARMREYSPGQRVWFQPEGQSRLLGKVSKCNKKTITVITDTGEQWKVSPTALHKAEEPHPLPRSDKVIPFRRRES